MAERTTDLAYLSQFRFLQTIPYVEALEQSDDLDCFICKEQYNMLHREWIRGGVYDFPVRLPCRHVLGIQCLAHWILSRHYNNRCGFCQAKILPVPDDEPFLDDSMDLVRLVISIRMGFSRVVKNDLLNAISVFIDSSPNMRTSRIDKDRTMMLFEEFLGHFAREDRRRREEGFQPPRVMQRRVARIEQAMGPGPVEPRPAEPRPVEPQPRRTSRLKRILLSLGFLVLSTVVAILCADLCWWIQMLATCPYDVVVRPPRVPTSVLMYLITLGMIEGALLVVFVQFVTRLESFVALRESVVDMFFNAWQAAYNAL